MVFRGGNGISLLGITYYAIVDIDGKYVMVEMLLSAAPFGDVSHTGENILRVSKQHFARYGVGEYESAISALSAKIVVHKDSVLSANIGHFCLVCQDCGSQGLSFGFGSHESH